MEAKFFKRTAAAILCFVLFAGSVEAAETTLIPLGRAVGIEMQADGVIITTITKVQTPQGEAEPAAEAGLKAGDVIQYINAQPIASSMDFRNALDDCDGQISVRYIRGGKQYQATVKPVRGTEGNYEIGVWLRSGMAGIGTVTFIDPSTGVFGALGHSVSDIDTGILLPLREGEIRCAVINGVVKGEKGKPGELKGTISDGQVCGKITANSESGIFGKAEAWTFGNSADSWSNQALPAASKSDIRCGEACILSDVSGTAKSYCVEISRVYHDNAGSRDMLITVTDPELIALTGGIVQGMSGSPVLQNGKIVGAVTHVLINDPTRGYGISVENMLSVAGEIAKAA